MGNQKRYQTWFMQKYLSTPDSESLVPDLIRYICGVYHPTNAVLCSDIVPRWAIIGWLLKCIKVISFAPLAKMYSRSGRKNKKKLNFQSKVFFRIKAQIPKTHLL